MNLWPILTIAAVVIAGLLLHRIGDLHAVVMLTGMFMVAGIVLALTFFTAAP